MERLEGVSGFDQTYDHEKAAIGTYAGFVVKRDRLLHDLAVMGKETGIVTVCAPSGFGKTALGMQYAAIVRSDPERGAVYMRCVSRVEDEVLQREVEEFIAISDTGKRPLVILDDVSRRNGGATGRFADWVRSLRASNVEVLITCRPSAAELVRALGDSGKISAHALTVRPKEYAEWASVFSIAPSLDVYALTQGIPGLVALLQSVVPGEFGQDVLGAATAELYRAALRDLGHAGRSLHALAALLLEMGTGCMRELTGDGIRTSDALVAQLARDYPMFGIDRASGHFECLGAQRKEVVALRCEVAREYPEVASRAARALVRAGRLDAAVELCETMLTDAEILALIAQYPTCFALAGHAQFVHGVFARCGKRPTEDIDAGLLLAGYASALVTGEYRMARGTCAELRRRADHIASQVSGVEWVRAKAMASIWSNCHGTDLPELPELVESAGPDALTERLVDHKRINDALVQKSGAVAWGSTRKKLRSSQDETRIDVSRILLEVDCCIYDALRGETRTEERKHLEQILNDVIQAKLMAIAARIRAALGIARLLAGEPLVDERAFVDAGTTAVRESDTAAQLLYLTAEGWQALASSQPVNAHFRAQQVLKLADEQQGFLRMWAALLEKAAWIQDASYVTVREEADALALGEHACSSAEAWTCAMHLSAARFDSELSAWYSLHKKEMLNPAVLPSALMALTALEARAESVLCLLPENVRTDRATSSGQEGHGALFEGPVRECLVSAGQVDISLFGGLRIERSGHTLSDAAWRRKKAMVLAARLALNLGSFVTRKAITEELWPDKDYAHAKEALYATLSSLRMGLGQCRGGLAYVLTQSDGLALNSEFVFSDVRRFDYLAREILLHKREDQAQQIVETCLKVEQIYRGALYVPSDGDPSFFLKMRRSYEAKFIDCMVLGIDTAVAQERLSAALWLMEAALRQAPAREDLIRRAMKVYDLCGRRREIVELYHSHLHYLEHELKATPEDETRRAYEELVHGAKQVVML